jgi:hypothetical protein
MINKIIKKKYKFKFSRGSGNVLFFKRHSNLFLVFLDSRWRHVVTLTSGFCKLGKTRKQKVSPLNMAGLVQKLKVYVDLHKVKYLRLFIKQRITFYFIKLKKLFKFYNLYLTHFAYILCRKHGQKRKRKIRRI